MKFVKENLFVLICAVIAIAALALRFTWVGSVQEETRTEMAARMEKAAQAAQLANQSINLPNNPQLAEFRGALVPELIAKKQEIQDWITNQAKQISNEAAVANRKDRYGVDARAGNGKKNVPLLNGHSVEGFLPSIQPGRDPHMMKPRYDHVFDTWLAQLLYNSQPQHGRNYDIEGSAPSANDVQADLARQAANEAANQPRGWGPSASPAATNWSKAETDRRTQALLTQKASQIRMYVNRSSFQIRGWYNLPMAPTENQIFEGVFDCWLQQDVVRAINNINGDSRSVLTSPIKRLERIAVGVAQATTAHGAAANYAPGSIGTTGQQTNTADGGMMFWNQAAAVPVNGLTAPVPPAPPQAGALDYVKSMTGRVGNADWDVSMMTIVVHLDPSVLNKFIAELYRQNNGYTVLDVKIESVDPFEAASNGYMYGNAPVVRADIQVEALFYRNWLQKVLPESYRNVLRIPEVKAEEQPAQQ